MGGMLNFFNRVGKTSFDDWISGAAGANASAEASRELSQWSALNLPSLQKQGYLKAGYNPLLINGNAPSSYMANVGAHQASDMNSIGSAFGGMFNLARTLMTLKYDLKQKELDNNKTEAEIAKIKADTLKTGAETEYPGLLGDAWRTGNSVGRSLGITADNISDLAWLFNPVDTIVNSAVSSFKPRWEREPVKFEKHEDFEWKHPDWFKSRRDKSSRKPSWMRGGEYRPRFRSPDSFKGSYNFLTR